MAAKNVFLAKKCENVFKIVLPVKLSLCLNFGFFLSTEMHSFKSTNIKSDYNKPKSVYTGCAIV